MKRKSLIKRYRIDKPKKFTLSDCDPADTLDLDIDKSEAKAILADDSKQLAKMQELLYAQNRWALLIVLQGMDAAGKDSVIEHVMSGINPQGCEVHSFKKPSEEELAHDFLWRSTVRLPARGKIGIFNRSYYEEVVVVRVHPELLERQHLPPEVVSKNIWRQRYEDINTFERHLTASGTVVLKFFLHISKEEQRRRFLQRLDDPAKRWKFSMNDVEERRLWNDYMETYEDVIRRTSTDEAPWHVVPADNKWFTRLVVAATMIDALDRLNLQFPKIEGPLLEEMNKVKQALEANRQPKSGQKKG
ncbi:MAG TPA: polyphosphate kinase 2 family protein [Xanthobacteraceae bacterium]|jgi:PPK2 family polyphosphate:nucleotide phosphotransferase|nr:polyphosphate kinase 2 family protein [Xanthobacteraceae bacterium]